jgi:hypothetical protein
MLAGDIPVPVIEEKLQIKGETMQRHIQRFFANGLWPDLAEVIGNECPNVASECFDRLFDEFKKQTEDEHSRRKAGIRRRKFWRKLSRQQQNQYYAWLVSNRKGNLI